MRTSILATLALALALAPVAGDAQQRGQRGQPPDTTRQRQDTTRAVIQEAAGEVSRGATRGLTTDQVRQLQDSLRSIGCNPGAADGTFGPQTRQALACARRIRGVASMNLNDLLRSLGVGFTALDSLATGNAARTAMDEPQYRYGDPTFVRDTGVMIVNLDTMPANAVGPEGVFVSSGTIARVGGGVWLRETSQERRDPSAQGTPDTAVYRLAPRPTADTLPMPVREPLPPRPDTTPTMTRDSAPPARVDTAPPPARTDTARTPARRDTTRTDTTCADTTRTRLRPDTAGRPLADSTLRRMRDELLLTPPPSLREIRTDSAGRDTTQRADTTRRTPPDTTRPDTTRRRRPPPEA